MLEAIVIAVFALLGVTTQRIVGFGIASLLTPILLIYYNPPISVTVTLLVATVACVVLLFDSRRSLQLSSPIVWRLFLAAIPGLLLGSYIVTRIDKAVLQIIIGILIIVGIFIQEYFLPKPRQPLRVSRGISISGFMAGLLNGAAAMAPPPLVIYMRSHVSTPDQIRQNLAATFILMNLASIATIHFLKPTSLTTSGIKIFLLLLPIILIGNVVGQLIATRIKTKQYHAFVFFAVIAAGITSVILGVIAL